MPNKCLKCKTGNTYRISNTLNIMERCYSCDYEKTIPDQRVKVIYIHFADRRKIQELRLGEVVGSCADITKVLAEKINEMVRRQNER